MTSDDIADFVVETFNAITDPVLAFAAENPSEVPELVRESSGVTVQVYPYDETEESFDRADASAHRLTVNVVVQGPIAPAGRKLYLELLRQLRSSLRETEIGNASWERNDTVSLYDFEALKTKRQFVSLWRATYFRVS